MQHNNSGSSSNTHEPTNGNIYKFSLRLSLDLYDTHILCIMHLVISALPQHAQIPIAIAIAITISRFSCLPDFDHYLAI